MIKVLQITLQESIPDFCMSKGETIEFMDGGHRRLFSGIPFYPNFGPYIQLNEIAELMISGRGNELMNLYFIAETKQIKQL